MFSKLDIATYKLIKGIIRKLVPVFDMLDTNSLAPGWSYGGVILDGCLFIVTLYLLYRKFQKTYIKTKK